MAAGAIPLLQHCKSKVGPLAKALVLGRFSFLNTVLLEKQPSPGHPPVTSVGWGVSKMLRCVSWLAG